LDDADRDGVEAYRSFPLCVRPVTLPLKPHLAADPAKRQPIDVRGSASGTTIYRCSAFKLDTEAKASGSVTLIGIRQSSCSRSYSMNKRLLSVICRSRLNVRF
jgi:hypothetical protein